MNKELLCKIADAIEAAPEEFDQAAWGTGCGTPRCVAGWAITLCEDPDYCTGEDVADGAREVLGLTQYQRHNLFAANWPDWWVHGVFRGGYIQPTAEQAAYVLRELAAGRLEL